MKSAAQILALEASAASWVGTPFCEGDPVKGSGVNCQNCVAEILFEAGWMPRFPVPTGPRDWARGQSRSLMVEFIESCPYFIAADALTENEECEPGRVLGFRVGQTIHHVALALTGGRMVHALNGHGVVIAPCIPDQWRKRLDRTWWIS